jgi:hypothetical protein
MKMRTIWAMLIALLLASGAVMAQDRAQTQPSPPVKGPSYQRGTENLSCSERESRCYDSRGLCDRYCQPQQASKADPQATSECFSRCSRGLKQCLDKMPAECDMLSNKNTRPLPKIEPR